MAFATSFAPQALSSLLVLSMRLPVFGANLTGALLIGEVVQRMAHTALDCVGFTGTNRISQTISDYTPTIVPTLVRPFKKLNGQELAVSILACCVISILGTQFMVSAFGHAPSTYNDVLSFVGAVRFDDQTTNPVLASIAAWWSRA